ncbi:MAG: ATP-binding protein [Candidatus Pacebacteria bacterium]|nr:ATP-binding protein [Candidatus Paceibacterota bacterium]
MTQVQDQSMVELINKYVELSAETEWIEFKANHQSPEKIGEYISALSNSACLHQKAEAYLIFGIENDTHKIVGTTFDHRKEKGKGNEPLESWLVRSFKPNIEFKVFDINYPGNKRLVVFHIPPAVSGPVKFLNIAHIRVGNTTQRLDKFPEKEAIIWARRTPFEEKIAKEDVSETEILDLLNHDQYFRLTKESRPKNEDGIIEKLLQEDFILKRGGKYHISNLGAILLAQDLRNFTMLKNKGVRIITYKGINRLDAIKDVTGQKGYAVGFENLISYIESQIPDIEIIGKDFRFSGDKYPPESIREFVANALIHQDFYIMGQGPSIEIFEDRIEICNAGNPLIEPDRFMDHPPKSRNEKLTDKLRRMKICEKRGSGVDRAIFKIELAQLPAPKIEKQEDSVKVVIFSHKKLAQLTKEDQCRACYFHSCVKHVIEGDALTNASLCKRLGIEKKNNAIASRIISNAIRNKLIRPFDPENKSNRYAKYLPYWA